MASDKVIYKLVSFTLLMAAIADKMNGRDKNGSTFVYFSPNSSFIPSFVERDYRILSNHFECSMVNYRKLIDNHKNI